MLAGDAKLFWVTMELEPGWNFMTAEMTSLPDQGVTAVGAVIVNSGAVTYFPREHTVKADTGMYAYT